MCSVETGREGRPPRPLLLNTGLDKPASVHGEVTAPEGEARLQSDGGHGVRMCRGLGHRTQGQRVKASAR